MNKELELTPEMEIKRLKAVIDEKNKCIEAFKKYDAERKAYYASLEYECKHKDSVYSVKHQLAKDKIGSVLLKFDKLEKQLDALLFVPSTNRDEYKSIVDNIFIRLKNIKKALKELDKC